MIVNSYVTLTDRNGCVALTDRRQCLSVMGWGFSMKRILIAGALALAAGGQALAADLPQPVPPRAPATYVPAVVPYYSWTGFYIGGNAGWGVGSTTTDHPSASIQREY